VADSKDTGPWRLLDGPAGVLHAYATPTAPGSPPLPVLLLCHELPRERGAAPDVGRTYPALADRLAQESGFRVAAGTLRGAGGSEGDFSAAGWLEDLRFLADHEAGPDGALWLVGFDLGGVLALRLAAEDERVRGVACLAAPADPSAWAADPAELLRRCRSSGVVRSRDFPPDLGRWAAEFEELRPLEAAARLGERPLLVVHGSDDPEVPSAAARSLADAASGPVDLRLVPGAGHWLRADPRVVATLIGWVERQR
jgi:pimeloyl-ACP methyl ester carboxylesterase